MDPINIIFPKRKGRQRSARSARPVVKSSVKAHDKKQVEFVFDFSLEPFSKFGNSSKNGVYEVEAFFFFPSQMAVGEDMYTKKEFYDDIRPLFRLREPQYTFKEFSAETKKVVVTPLQRVLELLTRLDNTDVTRKQDIENVVFQARLFACCFSNFLITRINRKCKRIREIILKLTLEREPTRKAELDKSLLELAEGADRLLKRSYQLIKEWDKVVARGGHLPQGVTEIVAEFKLVAEFCHFRFVDATARLSSLESEFRDLLCPFLKKRVRLWARFFHYLSKQKGYLWVDNKSSAKVQEEYFFRRSDLKKRMWQTLYLALETRRSTELQRQAALMFAAGLAASWALFSNFVILYFFMNQSMVGSLLQQNALNMSGSLVLILFVIAYALKDRIKDLGKEKARFGFFKKAPDFDYHVWFKSFKQERILLGNIAEATRFYVRDDQIPVHILEKRRALGSHLVQLQERVVHYQQKLRLNRNVLEPFLGRIWSVRNIFRFNLSRYLDYLDGSTQKHTVVDKHGKLCHLSIPKVYHLDVVLTYSFVSRTGKKLLGFDSNRLIMNKEGLIRIEQIR